MLLKEVRQLDWTWTVVPLFSAAILACKFDFLFLTLHGTRISIRESKHYGSGTTLALRKKLAAQAFALSAAYDSAIASWFAGQLDTDAPVVTRVYKPEFPLKYGCNPHQKPAQISSRLGAGLPFTVKNGVPGYINLLDAANAWQLVQELKQATGLAAAASFKHVSPAGAAVAVPLTDVECQAYEVTPETKATLTPVSLAYLRARNADPMCSFGDFSAVSDHPHEVHILIIGIISCCIYDRGL